MATGSGRATIFGFKGGVSWTGIGTLFKENGEVVDTFEDIRLKDDFGKTKGKISNDRIFKFKFLFRPVAASGTNTVANARLSLEPPALNAAVTLGGGGNDFDWSIANNAASGGLKWSYAGGWKLAFTNNGIATYEMEIEASADSTVNLAADPVTYS